VIFPAVRSEEWPHGIRCMKCLAEFRDGDPYIEHLEGFVGDTPATEIVCVACGGGVPTR
jgi:hypothetical protein